MHLIIWIISITLLVLCMYISVMNWGVFINNHILKRKWVSAIPLLGGCFGALGILVIPVDIGWQYSWIPLITDWGSLPMIIVTLIQSSRKP
jgi:hypothetical protein